MNYVPTGAVFHSYVNPERDMPAEAYRGARLTGEFLARKPLFAEIADELLDFIGDAPLIAHNADSTSASSTPSWSAAAVRR